MSRTDELGDTSAEHHADDGNPRKGKLVCPYEMFHGRPPTLTLRSFLSMAAFDFNRELKPDPYDRCGYLLGSAREYPSDPIRNAEY